MFSPSPRLVSTASRQKYCCPALHRLPPPAPNPLAGVLVCTACGGLVALVVICPWVRIPVSLPPSEHRCITSHSHTDSLPSNTSSADPRPGPFSFSFVQERIQLLVQFLLALPRPSV